MKIQAKRPKHASRHIKSKRQHAIARMEGSAKEVSKFGADATQNKGVFTGHHGQVDKFQRVRFYRKAIIFTDQRGGAFPIRSPLRFGASAMALVNPG